jgi:3-oxoacyl-[acyl-carrier protein] reductase
MVLVARTKDAIEALAAEINGGGGIAEACVCDLADDDAVDSLIEGVVERHARLDILVNNAGITRDGLILRMSDDDFDLVLRTNLRAAFRLCRAAARPMMRGRWGRMINIGSVVGLMGNAGQCNYAAAKAGLIGLTRSIGKELGGKGVTANVVAPGFIETDMTEALPEQLVQEAVKQLPLRRLGRPEEIGVEKGEVSRDTSFANDLNADSLDTVELVMEFEDEFDTSIPDDKAEQIQTVGQAIDYIVGAAKA